MTTAIRKTKELAYQVMDNYKSPTPRWAKICRNSGILLTAIGGGIVTAPALFPAALVSLAGYMIVGGTVATGIFQGFKKTE